jgi:hypothetical protein
MCQQCGWGGLVMEGVAGASDRAAGAPTDGRDAAAGRRWQFGAGPASLSSRLRRGYGGQVDTTGNVNAELHRIVTI